MVPPSVPLNWGSPLDEEGFSWLYIPLIRAALYMDGRDATYHVFVLAQANGYASEAWVQFFRDRFTLLGFTISQVPISPVAVGYIASCVSSSFA